MESETFSGHFCSGTRNNRNLLKFGLLWEFWEPVKLLNSVKIVTFFDLKREMFEDPPDRTDLCHFRNPIFLANPNCRSKDLSDVLHPKVQTETDLLSLAADW